MPHPGLGKRKKAKPRDRGPKGQNLRVVKAKTNRGRRVLEGREPKLVEDPKRLLCLYGGSPSQISRDALTELARLREASASREAVVKLSRRNPDARPFEAGGELPLEFLAGKSHAGAFALASHTKKRPHNIVLGRLFDGRLLDCVELGVVGLAPVERFGGAAAMVGAGNRPAVLFAGDGFDRDPALRAARSMLLDLLRGRQVGTLDLAALDRVVLALAPGAGSGGATAANGGGDNDQQQQQQQQQAGQVQQQQPRLQLRQYAVRLKKSGTPIPRVALVEIGPRLDFVVRRHRAAPPDLEREAMRQPPKPKAKKIKNASTTMLDGAVGRVYMPRQAQDLEKLALAKGKGVKRERRAAAGERKAKRQAPSGGGGGGGGSSDGDE